MSETLLSEDQKQEIIEILETKDLPIEKVKELYYANKTDKQIVGQVAMNLSLRTSVYDREKEKSDTMVELLLDIAKSDDMGSRWAVAKNPHTPVEVLEFLSKDDVNLVRALVATNPSTPSKILQDFFSDEKIVRDGLSGNPSTPVKLLHILCDDSDKMVRLRLAENSAAPKEILEKLVKDLDPNVAKAAELHLEKA
ncbi:MAG: hypothetical protein OEW60_06175 [Thiovulaceae bacterium]|nr:hypothetical protein [Sulfurimonadaceae bacterium]